jgi:hypothetical protein
MTINHAFRRQMLSALLESAARLATFLKVKPFVRRVPSSTCSQLDFPQARRRCRSTDYHVWSVNTEASYHEEGEAIEALLEFEAVAGSSAVVTRTGQHESPPPA